MTVTLSSGFTIRGLKNNEHGAQKLDEKEKAGFLRFAECPVATKRVSRAVYGVPCDGEFTDAKCCPHMDKIIAERRAEYRATSVEYGKNFESQTDRLLAHIQKQAADSVSERPAAPAGKKAPIGG